MHHVTPRVVAALLFALFSSSASAQPGQRQERLVTNGNTTIQVFVEGVGPTVIMLPSLGRGIEDFADLTRRLVQAGFRVVLPQPRGIGKSKGPMRDLTLHDLAGDVAAVVRVVGGGPATLVGHALGNRIARMVATDHPELVRQVVLVAAGGLVPIPADLVHALVRCFDETLTRDEHLAVVARVFFAKGQNPAVWERGWYRPTQEAQTAANSATPVTEWWAAGTAPLLVLQGAEDVIAPPENAEALMKEYGNREHPEGGACTVARTTRSHREGGHRLHQAVTAFGKAPSNTRWSRRRETDAGAPRLSADVSPP